MQRMRPDALRGRLRPSQLLALGCAALLGTHLGAGPWAAVKPPAGLGKAAATPRQSIRGGRGGGGGGGSKPLKTPWDEEFVSFATLEEAKATLSRPDLLSKWGTRAIDVLAMLDHTVGGALDLADAQRVAEQLGPLHVYFVGETGGGKSTLINALAEGVTDGAVPVRISATTPTECEDTPVPLPCGLVFVDTRGNRIPVPPVSLEEPGALHERATRKILYSRQLARWEFSLKKLKKLVEETDPAKMPAAAVVYVHRAGTRLVVDRLVEILSVPHSHKVPTFLVLSDINSVDDSELQEIRSVVAEITDKVGVNGRGRWVQRLEVNSVSKNVKNVEFKASGLPGLVAAMLNSFRPVDILQFVRWRASFRTAMGGLQSSLDRLTSAASATARAARSSLPQPPKTGE